MLSSITPLGERGRGNSWGLTVGAFTIGALAGGVAVGGVLGSLGWLVLDLGPEPPVGDTARLVALGVLAGLGALADAVPGGSRFVPSRRRQVDEGWIGAYRGWVYGGGYGVQLGVGVATVITSAATWVALGAMLLTGSPLGGAVVGAAFGLARSVPLYEARRVTTTAALRELLRRTALRLPVARVAAIGGLGLGAAASLACALLVGS